MCAYTTVGFKSAANLSEGAVDAARTVAEAVISSAAVSGGVGALFLIVTNQLTNSTGDASLRINPSQRVASSNPGWSFPTIESPKPG